MNNEKQIFKQKKKNIVILNCFITWKGASANDKTTAVAITIKNNGPK